MKQIGVIKVSAAPDAKKPEGYYNMVCPICGKKFHLKPYRVKKSKNHYCSKACHYLAKREYMKGELNHQYGLTGAKNASWKGGVKITSYGYRSLRVPDHPFADKDGLIFEHRLIAEKYLLTKETSVIINGIPYLSPEFVVHHKNGVRLDNRPENLQIMTLSEHQSMHAKEQNLHMTRDEYGRFTS